MKKFGKDYRNTQRMHLGLRAILATEIAQGNYPELTKDLLYMKTQNEGLRILPHDASLMNKPISKIDALKILMKLDRDYWELFLVFDMISQKYQEVLQ